MNSLKMINETVDKKSIESKFHSCLATKKHLLKEKTEYNLNEDI